MPDWAVVGLIHDASRAPPTLTVQPDRVGAARHRLDTVVEQLGGELTSERGYSDRMGGYSRRRS